jgi:hypothetical protein
MSLRRIEPLRLPDVTPGQDTHDGPCFRTVDPRDLLVDEVYQRGLSEQSIALIRRIVGQWSWRAFKPPVVTDTGDGLHVIDGQHTAIAAATHPDIEAIPVMVVATARREDRADAFVRHNRDRLRIHGTQLHYALVAAGDEDALTIQQVCERAGARVLKVRPALDRYQVGDTLAIEVLRKLVQRRHAAGARRVVQVCVEARMAPISAAALRAVEVLLFDPEYTSAVAPEDIATTLRELGSEADRRAALFAAEHRVPIWRGLVITLFRGTRKRRGHRQAA